MCVKGVSQGCVLRVCIKGVCSGCVLRVCCGRMVSYASVSFEGIESHLACFKGVLRSNGFV